MTKNDIKKLLNNTKLIIWDLDETLWNGTISEGNITITEENIELIKHLTDVGIINSICSKNNLEQVKNKLEELNILDYFVFISVNWEAKGNRIKNLIKDMQLRDNNVLFIDDNSHNLKEAIFFCKNIMTLDSKEIHKLYLEAIKLEKKDILHKRLNQYKILEKKKNIEATFNSNEEFLYSSNIRVEFKYDVEKNIDRILDLINRSNQLNFTKVRLTKNELKHILNSKKIKNGYINVKDNFGDYGIVGFFSIENNKLIHFCFSCRILGMGIEQYVYNKLNRPLIDIQGEVISNIENTNIPGWINQKKDKKKFQINKKNKFEISNKKAHSVLLKGPCDLLQIFPFISNKEIIDTDFTFTNNKGIIVESTGHTTNIVQSLKLNEKSKKLICSEVPFIDKKIYDNGMFKNNYNLIIISILQDANLGVYKRKDTGELFAFNPGFYPITKKENWKKLINKEIFTSGASFTEKDLIEFCKKYEFVGINTPEQIVENIIFIKKHLPKNCSLAIILGGELKYEKNKDPKYKNRHIVHKKINNSLEKISKEYDITLINVNKYLTNQNCFYDHFNHYTKPIYYKLACDIVDLINQKNNLNISKPSKLKLLYLNIKLKIKKFMAIKKKH